MSILKYELPPGALVYKPKNPWQASLQESFPLSAHKGRSESAHIKLDLRGSSIRYVPGQSLGVIAPGVDKNGKKHKLRLYSIASAPPLDLSACESAELCVRRLIEELAPGQGEYRGVASNYLCDLKKGAKLWITGPVGKAFALPRDRNLHLILLATGTGIAPFRSFLDFIFQSKASAQKAWRGEIFLFMGAKSESELLYMNKQNNHLGAYAQESKCRLYTARSREEKNSRGGRMYIQDKLLMAEKSIFPLLKEGRCVFYICGVKGMAQGIEESLQQICLHNSIRWPAFKEGLRRQGKWNVEEY